VTRQDCGPIASGPAKYGESDQENGKLRADSVSS